MRLDKIKTGVRLFQISAIVLLFLSTHTVITVLSSFISEGNVIFVQEEDREGNLRLDLSAKSTNMGFLRAKLGIEITLFSYDDEMITSNSTLLILDGGADDELEMSLFVPEYIADKYDLKDGKGILVVELNISTLWELFKITNVLKVVGEPEA